MTLEPYDDVTYLLDELERFDCLLEARLAAWWTETGRSANDLAGLYVSEEEVIELLRASTPENTRTETATNSSEEGIDPHRNTSAGLGNGTTTETGYRTEGDTSIENEHAARIAEVSRHIRERKTLTQKAGRTLRFDALAEAFGLGRGHRDVLLSVLAPELTPRYERIYGYLHDDLTRTEPTVGLVIRVFGRTPTEQVATRALFSQRSPLREHGIVRLGGQPSDPLPARTLRVDERVVDYLLGGDDLPVVLEELAEVVEPGACEKLLDDLVLDADQHRTLDRLSRGLVSMAGTDDSSTGYGGARNDTETEHDTPSVFVHLHGPYGSGRAAASEAMCAAAGLPLVRADLRRVSSDEVPETVALLEREVRLRRAALSVEIDIESENSDASSDESANIEALVRRLDDFDGHVFVTSADPLPPAVALTVTDHVVTTVPFTVPPYERRRTLWESVHGLPSDVDPAELATVFRFTPGEVDDAVATARLLATDGALERTSLYHGCRVHARKRLGSLARHIEPAYTWEDIVLPSDCLAQLREVAAHVKHRGQVYDTWEFGEKYTLGTGLVVLFSGPSGTGKTMATEIIAADAGLDLYKIDLASVVSKYIGETEKNLREVFDEAEGSDALLLFDEADALFGTRSEVSDARDRYANIEVNYLLQRIEEHDGIVVLTTNFRANIDDAFSRRIHLGIDFPPPDRNSRAEIWRRVFPPATPVCDLDIDFLAGFELTGGNIKNIALSAAFLAADDGRPVEMPYVIRATRREFQKVGQLVSADDFGEYREFLDT